MKRLGIRPNTANVVLLLGKWVSLSIPTSLLTLKQPWGDVLEMGMKVGKNRTTGISSWEGI